MKRRYSASILIFLLAAVFLLTACGDKSEIPQGAQEPCETTPLQTPAPKKEAPYPVVKVYFDGLLSDRGYYEKETLFLSPKAIGEFFELSPKTQIFDGSFTMAFPGFELMGWQDREYMMADSRYFYTPDQYLDIEGEIYLPEDLVERLFGITIDFSPQDLTASIDNPTLMLLRGGPNYYTTKFESDDLYWLSRIIYTEAGNQPLEGRIGVGNVVYNRVNSELFPDTVYDVIFERSPQVVQFDPAATNGIFLEPDEGSVIAACMCMEGYNTVGDSMYFLNPRLGDSTWFEKDLEFVVSIGDHDFYRS